MINSQSVVWCDSSTIHNCLTGNAQPCQEFFCNQSTKSCDSRPKQQGTPCAAASACKESAVCNGVEKSCPERAPKPNGTPCPELGDGACRLRACVQGSCIDSLVAAGTPCGARGGNTCQGATQCNGVSGECPSPLPRSGEPCGLAPPPTERCRTVDRCGDKFECLSSSPLQGVVCRASVDACDLPEVCSGESFMCSIDLWNQTCLDLRMLAATTTTTMPPSSSSINHATTTMTTTMTVSESSTTTTARLTLPAIETTTQTVSGSLSVNETEQSIGITTINEVTAGPVIDSPLGTPAIAGIAAGSAALLLIALIVAVVAARRRRRNRPEESIVDDGASMRPPFASSPSSQYDSVRSLTPTASGMYGSAPRASDMYDNSVRGSNYTVGNVDSMHN
jgi:hypothetical protein